MQLWNDYEGKTIAGRYELDALLGPEGRSALFAVKDADGGPAAIAVTESLNDEEQMVGCWSKVAAVKQENLLALKDFGRAELDGAPVTYAVMEASDGALDDLLKERVVTREEAVQIAVSVAGALQALHAAGVAHGQVRAENVVAVGETVKLRTDCIRDCGAKATEEEWRDLVWKDVQGLALLLLRALTLEKKLSPETRLVAPFDQVVERGINGGWGLTEILAVFAPTPIVVAPVVEAPAPVQYRLLDVGVEEAAPEVELPVRRVEMPVASAGSSMPFGLDWKMLAGGACGLVLLVLLGVHFLRGKPAAVETPVVASSPAPVSAPEVAAAPARSPDASGARSAMAGHMQAGWYVIAYTYNHEEEAWKKVAAIMKRHPGLQPEVVAPGGHGPFLVAIGGPMTRDGAASARSKALREGMPRDTFVRNYAGG